MFNLDYFYVTVLIFETLVFSLGLTRLGAYIPSENQNGNFDVFTIKIKLFLPKTFQVAKPLAN